VGVGYLLVSYVSTGVAGAVDVDEGEAVETLVVVLGVAPPELQAAVASDINRTSRRDRRTRSA
jgi:hypothetical protein